MTDIRLFNPGVAACGLRGARPRGKPVGQAFAVLPSDPNPGITSSAKDPVATVAPGPIAAAWIPPKVLKSPVRCVRIFGIVMRTAEPTLRAPGHQAPCGYISRNDK